MELKQELAAFRTEYERTAPAERVALYDAKVEELQATFPIANVLAVGQHAPDFVLPGVAGQMFSLSDVLREGPAVVVFYRGGWCPYCNIQLRAFQRLLPQLAGLGASLVAISPQLPDGSMSTAERNALDFAVLSDAGNDVARSFGLVYSLPEELRQTLRSIGKVLPDINGEDGWELPVPATFVITKDRRIVFSHIDIDYRSRCAPNAVVSALRSICST
ncbi:MULTISPECIES: peroxiredoxin-like family protein [Burkholderiaceae]|uniref:thioredoxin-dependent peroxiredoxin n=1 Tax=Caballeronia sordidicola TaxID=196367 RepID=A0A242M5C1_CABSO|nr:MULTISPECIES: peroxiredoxin-like family protein [Burkholderiaceae]AME28486.1 alkyl hydroperoxide reductase [Burkholderia sp. PAMC 26561]OTP66389.1 Peroxiredoxin [Caballeronia sordidicola]